MKKVLFVCSGNTCRSPMAQGLFNDMAKRENVDAVASSAGLYTEDGLDYSANSVEALKEEGISLTGKSKQINSEMLEGADYIFGLTCSLGAALCAEFPEYAEKVYRFPTEVSDPFGGDIGMYKISLAKITEGVERIIKAIKSGEI